MTGNPLLYQLDRLTRGIITPIQYVRTNHVNSHLIGRLGLETSLQGHQGCVNCLEWNERGTLLASGSDDCCLILWDPFDHRSVFTMNTGHVGNIFSVKFIPNLNEYLVVTGAADAKIHVHDITRMETRHVFSCHSGRIKRLANTPSEPFLFWSAAEDGTVRQFDLRDPTQAGSAKPCNVLVNLHHHIGSFAEAKCLALNPLRPDLLAVGSNDPYVRLYDRRKITLTSVGQPMRLREQRRFQQSATEEVNETVEVPFDSVRYFVPGHLPSKEVSYRRCFRHVNVTCVSFSPDGTELLANMSGDHIYLFNLNNSIQPYKCNYARQTRLPTDGLLWSASGSERRLTTTATAITVACDDSIHDSGRCRYTPTTQNCPFCTPCVSLEKASLQAAILVKAKAFVSAVRAYNDYIQRWPGDPQLYTGRATALLKRGWNGDVYSALLDCHTTLSLTEESAGPENADVAHDTQTPATCLRSHDCIRVTALLLSVRCLLRLDWVREARFTLNKVKEQYSYLIESPTSSKAPVTDAESNTSPPVQTLNGTKAARVDLSPVAARDHVKEESTLHKFFQLLDLEVRAKEKELEKIQQRMRFRETKANEDGVKPDSQRTTPSHGVSRSRTPDSIDQPVSRDQRAVMPGSESNSPSEAILGSEPDLPDVQIRRDVDDSWTPLWFRSRDADRDDDNANSLPTCSCIVCVTQRCKYDNTTESTWRSQASDYTKRFLGHCNAITDIKEANFFGGNGQYIVGGSDCGSFFVWDRETTNTVRILEADGSTVNCVQPHPSICLLASSGIDSVVRLWSPRSEDDPNQSRVVKDHIGAAERNQRRSIADPLELVLLNMGYRVPGLDAGFTGRRRHRRGRHSNDRARQQRRDRQRSSSSSQQGDEVDFLMDASVVAEDHVQDGDDISTAAAEEDYSNPGDLEGLPEIHGATVFSTDPLLTPTTGEVNGVSRPAEAETHSSSSNERSPQQDGHLGHQGRGRGRGGSGRTATRLSGAAHHRHKRLRSDPTSSLQPPVVFSAFDEDSSDSISDAELSGSTRTEADGSLRERHIDSSGSTGIAYARTRSGTPFVALHSVLHNGEHFVVYGTASSDGSASLDRPDVSNPEGTSGADPTTQSGDADENAVVELPCTMS
ncbi:hypothetical protein CRM22_004980 [Opisthorchis felineus]|uniref:WD and tetratricopeptide repeats protein 1 n=2 Tax=Opisthorchis felineus TaxID=147828 RepID=A0A4S2LTG7_OPIFE|nr:hypothetical protein CRM22_004980 [Opisthorchis felineus]